MDDHVSLVYSDFPMNWEKQTDRTEVLKYCAGLQSFLLEKPSERFSLELIQFHTLSNNHWAKNSAR